MSLEKWTTHFQRMQEGHLYPQQNGVWRLQSGETRAKKTSVRPVKRGTKRKLSASRTTSPNKRIKGPTKQKSKQSTRKPLKKKKVSTKKQTSTRKTAF